MEDAGVVAVALATEAVFEKRVAAAEVFPLRTVEADIDARLELNS